MIQTKQVTIWKRAKCFLSHVSTSTKNACYSVCKDNHLLWITSVFDKNFVHLRHHWVFWWLEIEKSYPLYTSSSFLLFLGLVSEFMLPWRITQKKRNTDSVDMYISQCVLYRNIMWWFLFISIPKSKSQYVFRWKISWLRINHFKKSLAFEFDEPYSPRLLYRSTTQESCCWRVSSSSIWASSASRSASSTSR